MMPRNNPVQIPAHLRGDAGPDTLAALVADGRRMRRFWPAAPATVSAAAPSGATREPRRGPGFRVTPDSAALFGSWLDREG